jgi:hypothetical protein
MTPAPHPRPIVLIPRESWMFCKSVGTGSDKMKNLLHWSKICSRARHQMMSVHQKSVIIREISQTSISKWRNFASLTSILSLPRRHRKYIRIHGTYTQRWRIWRDGRQPIPDAEKPCRMPKNHEKPHIYVKLKLEGPCSAGTGRVYEYSF